MKSAPTSVRIIYVMTLIIYYIILFAAGSSVLIVILSETGAIGEDFELRVKLPVSFDLNETGTVEAFGINNNIRIEQASGQMHLVDTPIQFTKYVIRFMFVVLLLTYFMTWKFKMFITNIKNGLIFESENINNLKHIAYGILILWLLIKVYSVILYFTVVKYIKFDTIHMNLKISDDANMLFGALLLWVLAHIFMKGVEMKQEQELTI